MESNSLTVVVSLLALFGLGTCFSLLGAVSNKLMARLNINAGQFGTLVSGFTFAAMISSLVVGVALDSIGFKTIAIIGFAAVTAVILLLARGRSFQAVLVAAILLGIAAMALNAAGNTLAPKVLFGGDNPAQASNLGNVFFGLGLFLTPMITSALFKKSYETAVSALSVLMVVGLLVSFIAPFPEVGGSFALGDAFGLLANPVVLVAALLLFCYISLEVSLTNWLAPLGKEVLTATNAGGDRDAQAAQLLSSFAIAMMVGRLVAAFIPNLTGIGAYVIAGVALVSALVIVSMVGTKSFSQSRLLAAAAGFFFAPIFPTTVGVTFSKVDPAVQGSAFGIIFAVGLLGATIVPKMIGNMATGSSIQRSMRLLLPLAVVLAALAIALQFVG